MSLTLATTRSELSLSFVLLLILIGIVLDSKVAIHALLYCCEVILQFHHILSSFGV
jgi:hypothetical protein